VTADARPQPRPVLYHLAVAAEWEAARASGGPYRRSTLGRSLHDEGFVHCSFADQVTGVADRFYRGRSDIVLLTIDPARLGVEVRVEDLTGDGERFPHVYGPVPIEAVLRADGVPLTPDGRLAPGPLLGGPADPRGVDDPGAAPLA
jgi:glutathione S-transferase